MRYSMTLEKLRSPKIAISDDGGTSQLVQYSGTECVSKQTGTTNDFLVPEASKPAEINRLPHQQ